MSAFWDGLSKEDRKKMRKEMLKQAKKHLNGRPGARQVVDMALARERRAA